MSHIKELISNFFHSGIPYLLVSTYFIIATHYALNFLTEIISLLREIKEQNRRQDEQNVFKTDDKKDN